MLKIKHALADALVAKKIRKKLGGRLKFFIAGGAPLPKEIGEFFYAFGILICEGYGLTETSPVIACNSPKAFRFGTVGRPIAGVKVKIAEDGEILTQGPNIMKGYYRNAGATAEVIRDGWFFTGDIGALDKDGFLSITDRKKDIIVTSGGKNVPPQNIEQMLCTDMYINQVCVCGDRRPYLTALIVPNWDMLLETAAKEGWRGGSPEILCSDDHALRFMRERMDRLMADLPSYSCIKQFTLLVKEFTQPTGELTPTLKIKRKVIGEKFRGVIERMYAVAETEKARCDDE